MIYRFSYLSGDGGISEPSRVAGPEMEHRSFVIRMPPLWQITNIIDLFFFENKDMKQVCWEKKSYLRHD